MSFPPSQRLQQPAVPAVITFRGFTLAISFLATKGEKYTLKHCNICVCYDIVNDILNEITGKRKALTIDGLCPSVSAHSS